MTAKQTKPTLKVVAAIICRNNMVLLARRPTGDPLAGFWEFPGGKIEPGETPQCALERELHEEFGVNVRVGDFVGSHIHHVAEQSIELLAFWVTTEEEIIRLNAHDGVAWVRPTDLGHYPLAPADEFIKEILISRRGGSETPMTTDEKSPC